MENILALFRHKKCWKFYVWFKRSIGLLDATWKVKVSKRIVPGLNIFTQSIVLQFFLHFDLIKSICTLLWISQVKGGMGPKNVLVFRCEYFPHFCEREWQEIFHLRAKCWISGFSYQKKRENGFPCIILRKLRWQRAGGVWVRISCVSSVTRWLAC